jgi:putative Holliday junction resolvase
MKYIGIDYGSSRIGIAVSDESGRVAFPLGTIDAGEKAFGEILDIITENDARIAVVGESKDLSGRPNPIMKAIGKFAAELQENNIAVEFEPEFYTSAQASRQGRDKRGEKIDVANNTDASAAALILQSYLDRMNQAEEEPHEH